MDIALGVAAALLLVGFITVVIRSMELTSANKSLTDRNTNLQRDLKKLQTQMESQASKYQAKAQEVAKSGNKTKDQKQRISRLSDELHTERAELKKARARVQELSSELNRLRIGREKLREELAGLKEQQRASSAVVETPVIEEAGDDAPAVEASETAPETAERAPQKKGISRLEKDLERVRTSFQARALPTAAPVRAISTQSPTATTTSTPLWEARVARTEAEEEEELSASQLMARVRLLSAMA